MPVPDDLPSLFCAALAQDRDGFLWIGTRDGLIRFDGAGFRLFRSDPLDSSTLGGSYVRVLHSARDGRLWAGTFGGGVSVYDPATETFTRYRKSLSHARVEGLAEDRSGRIWIATNEGLDRLDPESGRVEHFRHVEGDPRSLADHRVRGLLVDRSGALWVGSRAGLQVRKSETSGFVAVASDPARSDSLFGKLVSRLFEDEKGRIWIGTTEHGAAVLDPASGNLLPLRPQPLDPDGLSHYWVYGFAQVTPREVWVATFGGGVDIVDPETLRVVTRLRHDPFLQSSLGGDRIGAILKDRLGVVWIGTWGQGMAWHDPASRAFENLRHSPNDPDGLSITPVIRALELSDGTIWVGTDGNGIDILDASRRRIGFHRPDPKDPRALIAGSVSCLAEGPDGSIWVATLDGALHRHRRSGTGATSPQGGRLRGSESGFKRMLPSDGLPGGPIRTIAFGRDGILWAGAAEGMARIDPATEKIEVFRHRPEDPETLSGHAAEAIVVRPDGKLWIGTDGGLDLFDPATGRATRVAVESERPGGLPTSWVPDLLLSSAGRLWLATPAGAFVLESWDGKRAKFLSVSEKIDRKAFPVESVIEDREGKIWLGPSVRVDPRTWTAEDFGPAEGRELRSFPLASRALMRDGSLLFGSAEGLLIVHPQLLDRERPAPALVATSAVAGGNAVPGTTRLREVVLPPGRPVLRLELAALDLIAPERISYSHRLAGFESEWTVAPKGSRTVTYTNLPPGRYTFEARGLRGKKSLDKSELHLAVVVEPAFHQTAWFRLFLLLVIAGVAFGGYRLRIRQLEARERHLVSLVAERTEELRVANAELARQNVLLSEHMKLQEDMERISRHDLRTPLAGILSVIGLLRRIPGLGPKGHALVDLVERGSYRVLDMVNLSLDLVRMEKGTYRLREKPLDLVAVARHVCDDLAEQAASKTVAFVIESGAETRIHAWGEELLSYSMIANLVKNALEASPPSETVQIRVTADGERAEIAIHNKGAVPLALREGFFEKYRSAGKEGGTGLGTYSARLLAETQRGSISMETSEAAGTTIRVRLPKAEVAAAEVASGRERGQRRGKLPSLSFSEIETLAPLRVLVVDDDPFSAAVLTANLPSPPLHVETAVNGLMALERIRSIGPDLVFLDLEMPVMGGFETVERLREQEAAGELGRRAWVVGLSSHDDEMTKESFLAAGCDRYLVKPAEPDELQSILIEVSRARPMAAEPALDTTAGVRRAGGDAKLHRRLLDRFLEEAGGVLEELEAQKAVSGDRERLRIRLHTIKGTAATLGVPRLSSAAASLEAALRRDPEAVLESSGFAAALEATRGALPGPVLATEAETVANVDEGMEASERARVFETIARLSMLLEASDLAAAECFEGLVGTLAGRREDLVREIRDGMERLDFEAAARSLRRLKRALSPEMP